MDSDLFFQTGSEASATMDIAFGVGFPYFFNH